MESMDKQIQMDNQPTQIFLREKPMPNDMISMLLYGMYKINLLLTLDFLYPSKCTVFAATQSSASKGLLIKPFIPVQTTN